MRGDDLWEVWAWYLVVREVRVGRDKGIPFNPLIVVRVLGHLLLPGLGDTRRDHWSLATSVAKRVILGLIVYRLHNSSDLLHHRILRRRVLILGGGFGHVARFCPQRGGACTESDLVQIFGQHQQRGIQSQQHYRHTTTV